MCVPMARTRSTLVDRLPNYARRGTGCRSDVLLGGSWDLVRLRGPFKGSIGYYKGLGYRGYMEDHGA